MQEKKSDPQFTISVLTEDQTNALLRVTACLARHRVRIESLTCTEAADAGAYRQTVVVRAAPERIRRAMKQIGSGVGVLEAGCHSDGETVDREVALYKIERGAIEAGGGIESMEEGEALKDVLRSGRARVLVAGSDYIVIEKTGSRDEIEEMLEDLAPFGVMEFVRSGRVTVTRSRPGAIERPETVKTGAAAADGGRR